MTRINLIWALMAVAVIVRAETPAFESQWAEQAQTKDATKDAAVVTLG
jgi:hypothetical protein